MQLLLATSAVGLLVSSAVAQPSSFEDSPFLVRRGGTDSPPRLTSALLHGSGSSRSLSRQGSGGSSSSVSTGVGFDNDDRRRKDDYMRLTAKEPQSLSDHMDRITRMGRNLDDEYWKNPGQPRTSRPHSEKYGSLGYHLNGLDDASYTRRLLENAKIAHERETSKLPEDERDRKDAEFNAVHDPKYAKAQHKSSFHWQEAKKQGAQHGIMSENQLDKYSMLQKSKLPKANLKD